MEISWSIYPREYFAVDYEGHTVGFGLHPGFDIPGVWNIFVLHFQSMDKWVNYSGDLKEYPIDFSLIPLCIGGAFQRYGVDKTIGEIAVSLTAAEFLEAIDGFSQFIPRVIFGEELWWQVTRKNLEKFNQAPTNVVPVNFRQARRLPF